MMSLHRKTQKRIKQAVNLGLMTIQDHNTVPTAREKTRRNLLRTRQSWQKESLQLNHIMGFPPTTLIPNRLFPCPLSTSLPRRRCAESLYALRPHTPDHLVCIYAMP